MFVVLFAASVLWAKAAGYFGKVERKEQKKRRQSDRRRVWKISAFQLVLFTVESVAETRDKLAVISVHVFCGLVCRTDLHAAV